MSSSSRFMGIKLSTVVRSTLQNHRNAFGNSRKLNTGSQFKLNNMRRTSPAIELMLRRSTELKVIESQLRTAKATDNDMPLHEPILGDISSYLCVIEADNRTMLNNNLLKAHRISAEQARIRARQHLSNNCDQLEIIAASGRYRITYTKSPDLTASFLLSHTDWIPQLAIMGEPVIAIGSRRSIYICSSASTFDVSCLRLIAQDIYGESLEKPIQNGSPLTPHLLTIRSNKISYYEQ